ncbi:MAG: AraC family transcriptional regulator [Burkholderiaceae bacterium]|nr:AraC family transcriptional regulator [Burkholderiaceae bacterium]
MNFDDPLAAFPSFRTMDLEEARRHFCRILSPHALHLVDERARLDVCCRSVELDEAVLLYARYGTAVRLDPGALEDFYLVGMPIAGSSTIRTARWELVSHPSVASVQSCLQPMQTQWDDECSKLSIKIPRAALDRRLASLLGYTPSRPIEFLPQLDLASNRGATWNGLIRFLLTELTPRSFYLASPAGRRTLDDALISTLLLVQPHNYSEALRAEARAPAPSFVRRAEEMIEEDPTLEGGVGALAERVGISARALYAGFRRYRQTTPVEFARGQRLAKAHEMLRDARPGTHVTDVALSVGYSHFGRFAAEYRARYGELPSETLRAG